MSFLKKALLAGDAMIPENLFEDAFNSLLADYVETFSAGNWEPVWEKLQHRRLEVEKKGPEIEVVPDLVKKEGKGAEILFGLFVPVSSALMDSMPDLKIVGVCRAGTENVNLKEATERGIIVFNVMGRNAEAVSDFAVGMMIAEARNIARAHFAIKNGEWRKTFVNSDNVLQLRGKRIGLVGFGFIGQLVAKKLSGFDVEIVVFDPYLNSEKAEKLNVKQVDKETLFKTSDFISIHARLTAENKNMIGIKELELMKPTSYLINTGRAGLVDFPVLVDVLKNNKIAGAALDVFPTEPVEADNPVIGLDNVTLTTHIAGTTTEALTKSPFLLMEDVKRFIKGEETRFIINPEVLDNPKTAEWVKNLKKSV